MSVARLVTAVLGMTGLVWGVLAPPAHAGLTDGPIGAAAQVTPTIDGTMSAGEWSDAHCVTETVTADDGSLQDLTVCVKNDGTTLYMLVQITNADYSDPAEPCLDVVNVLFDNDDDGVVEVGENRWAIRFDGAVRDLFNPTGVPHHSATDTGAGGTNDLTAAITHSNPFPNEFGVYTAEFAAPLNSGDVGHDFGLAPGDAVGFAIRMADGDPSPGGSCSAAVGSFFAPASVPPGWAQIVIFEPIPIGHDVAVTGIEAPDQVDLGATVPVSVVVENGGDAAEADVEVTLKDGDTEIGSQTISLIEPGTSETLVFLWTTAGLPEGLRTLTAEASAVPGETDTADNVASLVTDLIPAITQDTAGNVVLGPGDRLAISNGATLRGTVTVDGGTLVVKDGSTVDGHIRGLAGGDILLRGGSTVTGELHHRGGTLLITGGSAVLGNAIRANSRSTVIEDGSSIGGNFEIREVDALRVADSSVGGNILIDITGAGIKADTLSLAVSGTAVGGHILIDITGAGVQTASITTRFTENLVGGHILIDITGAGVQTELVDTSLAANVVGGNILIDITGAGVQPELLGLSVAGNDVDGHLSVRGGDEVAITGNTIAKHLKVTSAAGATIAGNSVGGRTQIK